MTAIADILLPIFGLMALGAIAGRRDWFGAGATDRLNRFVVRVALPAQLALATAQTPGRILLQPGLLMAFGGGCLLTALIGWALDWRRPVERAHRLSGAAIEGLCAGYGNTAFIGMPLCLAAFGPGAVPCVVVATLLTVCALFALAIALVEFENARGDASGSIGPAAIIPRVAAGLLRNPLVFMPLLGVAANIAGFGLWTPLRTMAEMLGAASSPCALVTIGLFLAETGRSRNAGAGSTASSRASSRDSSRAVTRLVALKLVVQPAVTALMILGLESMPALALDRATAAETIVLAALPTGTGPFMLARLYDREAHVASRAILISTLLSALTVAALLRFLR